MSQSDMSRRSFISGASVAAAAMGMAAIAGNVFADEGGVAATEVPPAYDYAKTVEEVADYSQLETDVLVVGGGGAGICAALAAAENGANVILAEKMGYFGGATALSSGSIPAVGTSLQNEAGVKDSIWACAVDIFRPSNYSVRPDLVYTVSERGKEIVEWTEGYGVVWTLDSRLRYGQTTARIHMADGSGAGLVQALVDSMSAVSSITSMLNCEVRGLVVEGDAVVGAYGVDENGADVAIAAKNTILATSGFGNNPEMLAKYCPEAVDAVKVVAPGATGESILWAKELGADLQNMGAWQGYAFRNADSGGAAEQALVDNGGIFVNAEGHRFTNEYAGYSTPTPHILAQTGHIAYLCFTDIQAELSTGFSGWRDEGLVYEGETPAELAEAIGADPSAVEEAFAEYQAGIEKGEDKFNRSKLPANFDGPYYAIKVTGEIRHTQGGMVTDIAGHVLREDGSLIKGLYAAGGCSEGFSSGGDAAYMSGNGLIQALLFGKITGELAATEDRESSAPVSWEKKDIGEYL